MIIVIYFELCESFFNFKAYVKKPEEFFLTFLKSVIRAL